MFNDVSSEGDRRSMYMSIHTHTDVYSEPLRQPPVKSKINARNCLSLCDPLNDLSACLPVYLSVFIIIRICVCLTNFYLDLFVLLSP